MHRKFLFAAALAFASTLFAAGLPVNLDFESGAPGELPTGWSAPADGFTAVLTAEAQKSGKQSLRMNGAPPPGARETYGDVMQEIDVTPYRGKRLRLRAAVRVEGDAVAGLWMRVDRPGRRIGFLDNMGDRPITTSTWTYYDIVGDVPADAVALRIGMTQRRRGSTSFDDLSLETIPTPPLRHAPPRAITSRGMENLIAFTRLFGIVRHFHPTDEAMAADWEAIAVNGAEYVETAKDANELAARLSEVFLPIAPTLRVVAQKTAPHATVLQPEHATAFVYWEHYGFGQSRQDTTYTSDRLRRALDVPADPRIPDPRQPYTMNLGGGVFASLPLAVFADASHTLPHATKKSLDYAPSSYSGNDRATRIGVAVIVWNALEHFFPYFDVVDVDWSAQLKTLLRAAGSDRDEHAFLRTLQRMMASLHDGHGGAQISTTVPPRATLPLLWRTIENTLVITGVDPQIDSVHIGEEVVAIGGKSAMQAIQEAESLVSAATPQYRRYVALRDLSSGVAGSRVVLTIRDAAGAKRDVTLSPEVRKEPVREPKPETIMELKPGLWYVDVDRFTDSEFEAALPKLANARGIVFDLRGYPRSSTAGLRHLSDTNIESARWNVPLVRKPGHENVEWDTSGRWNLEPLAPRLTKNLVFLAEGQSASYAESWLGIIEAYKLATIVGETTAGTNGNYNAIRLPGGYRVTFTGMKVLKHDGSRHHGVGIAPNVPVERTLAGIRAGRDEQLEKAIEILEQ
ncbi:MAG TPA: S41 family peptidase [Thermoanaerobaculia bacterium]|nr:S41 family peptidase [Thermoanaerobaculia bacterium]